jgi:alanine racemase
MSSATGVLKINLSAIASNWRFMREFAPKAEVGAVIKANAYSLGAQKVAEMLSDQGCRSFFVTTLDEAFETKSFLDSSSSIYVLGGVMVGDEDVFAKENFIPVIYSVEMLHRWIKYCEVTNQFLATAIKIDTGMSRFGMQLDEFINEFLGLSKTNINFVLLMSHLACADDKLHPLNELQLKKFQTIVAQVKTVFPSLKASLANSSGIFLGEEWHFDLVRPGAALYGINPHPGNSNPLQKSISLELPILQIKTLVDIASVGYGAGIQLESGTRLAVVAGGYADGVHRSLGLKPQGVCLGKKVIAVGRVSMDSTIFDVTDVDATDEEILSAGIEVIGDRFSLDDLIKANNSLGYEVLTSLGQRYQRHYLQES